MHSSSSSAFQWRQICACDRKHFVFYRRRPATTTAKRCASTYTPRKRRQVGLGVLGGGKMGKSGSRWTTPTTTTASDWKWKAARWWLVVWEGVCLCMWCCLGFVCGELSVLCVSAVCVWWIAILCNTKEGAKAKGWIWFGNHAANTIPVA